MEGNNNLKIQKLCRMLITQDSRAHYTCTSLFESSLLSVLGASVISVFACSWDLKLKHRSRTTLTKINRTFTLLHQWSSGHFISTYLLFCSVVLTALLLSECIIFAWQSCLSQQSRRRSELSVFNASHGGQLVIGTVMALYGPIDLAAPLPVTTRLTLVSGHDGKAWLPIL